MDRMLEFISTGDYSTDSDNDTASVYSDPKLIVLAHLSCHAIANSYQVAELGDLALRRAGAALHLLTPDDFTHVMSVVMNSTDAESIRDLLLDSAVKRLDELAECDSFQEMIFCKHLPDIASLDDIETVKDTAKTAVKLASLSAIMLCMGSFMHAQEKSQLNKKYNDLLSQNKSLRDQVERDKIALLKSEEIHNEAFEAIQAAASRATDAENKLHEVRARFMQDEQRLRKATQTLQVKTLLANEVGEMGKPEERTPHQRTPSHLTTSHANARTLFGLLHPGENGNPPKVESSSLEDSELSRAQTQISKLKAEKIFTEDSIHNLRTINKSLLAAKTASEGETKRLQAANAALLKSKADLTKSNAAILKSNVYLNSTNVQLCKILNGEDFSSKAADQAKRRQYIIRRVCNLAGAANACTGCRTSFNAKFVWQEQNFVAGAVEPEVIVKCKKCGKVHDPKVYLHAGPST